MSSVRATASRPALRRPRECAVSGTSAGLAAHLGWSAPAVRAIFVLLTLLWGAGALLYAWIWVLTPWDEGDAAPSRSVPVAWILTALSGLGLIGTLAVLAGHLSGGVSMSSARGWFAWVAVTAVLAVAGGLWATFADRADPARGPRHELAVRVVVTGILVALVMMQASIMQQTGLASFLLAVAILGGVAIVYSSTLIAKWRELSGERVRRIREEQRAEMAAHLHDSVLQTLALIQNRSGASSEVARLARAQERELRSWLYDGDSPADSDLPTDLRDYAAALELDYPVRIEVVSAGLSTERASGDVAAAAREAMLNAARHAGGEVSVYIEGSASGVDVYVRDRGPGFSLAAVPGDRLGVRESIIGRLRRTGGSATVKPGAGGVGTEVHLHSVHEEARRG
ncbi:MULTISPECIES: ATP-binding protein [unclassified Microbacterium]|uniref:ATP-binding protein n=1 Tax=unclassified Microbacterium TaxID=2609290 RepID=UPI00214C6F07|nr:MULTISPECIES: ATP-binding protein [unclassified Microbacterium]MCR2809015.1 PspC domain-containing protein [Microbacterium sp. zg.B185]WIM18574.1 PspC domain-containing protein [Microbacterium sp. zg-B185]